MNFSNLTMLPRMLLRFKHADFIVASSAGISVYFGSFALAHVMKNNLK